MTVYISSVTDEDSRIAKLALSEFPWREVKDIDEMGKAMGNDTKVALLAHGDESGITIGDSMYGFDELYPLLKGREVYFVSCKVGSKIDEMIRNGVAGALGYRSTFVYIEDMTIPDESDVYLKMSFLPVRAALHALGTEDVVSAFKEHYATTLNAISMLSPSMWTDEVANLTISALEFNQHNLTLRTDTMPESISWVVPWRRPVPYIRRTLIRRLELPSTLSDIKSMLARGIPLFVVVIPPLLVYFLTTLTETKRVVEEVVR